MRVFVCLGSNSMETVNFEAEIAAPTVIDDMVIRHGVVGKAGDYTDKNFSLTPDEIKAAAAAFKPCGADIEHRATILDGHVGNLVAVHPSADGSTLYGTFAEPKWMGQVLGDAARKVSLTWDRASKTITGIAHTLNPRIPEAALFNAYAQFSRGEVVTPLADNSAQEPTMPNEETVVPTKPGVWEFIQNFYGFTKEQAANAKAQFDAGKSVRELQLEAEVAKMKADNEAANAAAFNAAATTRADIAKTFATELVTKNLIMPAQVDAVTAEFTRALEDDARTPQTVTFSVVAGDGVKDMAMTRADSLKAHYLGRQPHNLTQEVVQQMPPETVALFAQEASRMRNADETTVRPAVLSELRSLHGLSTPANAATNGHN